LVGKEIWQLKVLLREGFCQKRAYGITTARRKKVERLRLINRCFLQINNYLSMDLE
jgi:hypothetical protein